ncbi:MAG: hypothetical protein ABIW49_11045 [Knoellia sp.]
MAVAEGHPRSDEDPGDALLVLSGPRSSRALFTLAVKRWSTAPSSAVVGVLAAVQRRSSLPVILVTDYASQPLRRACDELGIGYVDSTGWVSVSATDPVVTLRSTGADRPPATRKANAVTRLNGIASGRIIRALLELQPPIGVQELKRQAGVASAGSVSKILPTLALGGAVERDGAGRVVSVHRRRLLERWTQDYSFLNGNGVVFDFLAPRGLGPVVTQVASLENVTVTGAFAGARYLQSGTVPVVPPGLLTLYAADARRLGDDLGLVRMDRASSNVLVAAPRDASLLTPEASGRASSLRLAPRAQVLADLMTLPGRETLLAEQMMDQLALGDPSWSEE